MSDLRRLRFANNIKEYIAEIFLRDLNIPELKLLTVTKVVLNSNSSIATIYISIYNGNEEKKLQLIKKYEKMIRSKLASKLDVYKVPQLLFVIDNTLNVLEEVDSLFKKYKI